MTTVIDASVIVKLLTEERHSDIAAATVAATQDRIAPDIVMVEIASALSKKARYAGLPADKVAQAMKAVPALFVRQIALADLLDDAMALSIELKCAFYDCLYLALANQRDCAVITADAKFARIVADSRLAHRLTPLVPLDAL